MGAVNRTVVKWGHFDLFPDDGDGESDDIGIRRRDKVPMVCSQDATGEDFSLAEPLQWAKSDNTANEATGEGLPGWDEIGFRLRSYPGGAQGG